MFKFFHVECITFKKIKQKIKIYFPNVPSNLYFFDKSTINLISAKNKCHNIFGTQAMLGSANILH